MFQRVNFIFWLTSIVGLIAALVTVFALYGLFDTIESKTETRTTLMSLAGGV